MEERDRHQERERLRRLLIQVRDDLEELIDHLEHDVLPTRMVGASAHHGLIGLWPWPAPSWSLRRAPRGSRSHYSPKYFNAI
jgi:hypothetical protein